MDMSMTHYMELLASNQPWNLIIFMAIPVILAETIAVTELAVLFSRNFNGTARLVNRIAGLLVGVYFLVIFFYLFFNAFVPLTTTGQWRGPADVVAVTAYLLGVIPLLGISLIEFGVLARNRNAEGKLKLHATFVAIFLVTAHIAMISGMLSPSVFVAGHSMVM